jgi:hypothetical protein
MALVVWCSSAKNLIQIINNQIHFLFCTGINLPNYRVQNSDSKLFFGGRIVFISFLCQEKERS